MRRLVRDLQTVLEVLFDGPVQQRVAWDNEARRKAREDVLRAIDAWKRVDSRISKERRASSKDESDAERSTKDASCGT